MICYRDGLVLLLEVKSGYILSRGQLPFAAEWMPLLRHCASNASRRPGPVSAGHHVATAEYPAVACRLSCTFPALPASAAHASHYLSLRDFPKSLGKFAVWYSPILAESLAPPGIEPVLTVLHFMRCAGLSASIASPKCARTCDPDGFRSGSGSPTGALAAPLPRLGL